MATFLKIVSGIYLAIIWGSVAIVFLAPTPPVELANPTFYRLIAVVIAVVLTIPAAALFAFGRLVEDARYIRIHLAAMRKYYEPEIRQ